MASALADGIPLPNGRTLRPRQDLLFVARCVHEGKTGRIYQAVWQGSPHCVGYGESPEQAVRALWQDTATRWLSPEPPALENGRPSAAQQAWRWVRQHFREVS